MEARAGVEPTYTDLQPGMRIMHIAESIVNTTFQVLRLPHNPHFLQRVGQKIPHTKIGRAMLLRDLQRQVVGV